MEISEILFVFVVLVLTFFLVIVGVQVFFILKDLRLTLSKLNRVLDDAALISQKIKAPLVSLSSATLVVRAVSSFLSLLKGEDSDERKQK